VSYDPHLVSFEKRTRERIEQLEAQVALLSERLGIPYTPPSSGVPVEVASLVNEGKRIEAIKLYREMTGCGLEEARDAVAAL
jgi:ribosomal protein L7/L12